MSKLVVWDLPFHCYSTAAPIKYIHCQKQQQTLRTNKGKGPNVNAFFQRGSESHIPAHDHLDSFQSLISVTEATSTPWSVALLGLVSYCICVVQSCCGSSRQDMTDSTSDATHASLQIVLTQTCKTQFTITNLKNVFCWLWRYLTY